MIPDDMIKKAKAAYINKRCKTCSHDSLIAALEAVAADIWQTGYNFGSSDEITRALGIITDDQRTPNPYERIEHA